MKPLVVGIGEFLWDLLPSGPQMGGAPANFACHAAALGAEGAVISAVGRDKNGDLLLDLLGRLGVETAGIARHQNFATGTVSVDLDEEGQPTYTIHSDSAWDHLVAGPAQLDLARRASALCFGTLAQREPASAAAVQAIMAAADPQTLRILDVNLRSPFFTPGLLDASLKLADVLKLNAGEVDEIARALGLDGGMRQVFDALRLRYGLRLIACTRGAEGSVIYDGDTWAEHPGCPAAACDTVGAGDSFTAALVMGLLKGWSLEKISEVANEVAAFVCSQPGAIPSLPEELKRAFYEESRSSGELVAP